MKKVNFLPGLVILFLAFLSVRAGLSFDVWAIGEEVHICPVTGEVMENRKGGEVPLTHRESNWVWNKAENLITLYAAKGEMFGCQLVVERGEGEVLRGIRVAVSDLEMVGGGKISSAEHIRLFREWYVYRNAVAGELGAGWYVDPLVPLSDSFSQFDLPSKDYYLTEPAVRLENQQNQAIWIDFYIPREVVAGEYHGEIQVVVTEPALEKKVNLKIVVWDFTISPEFHVTFELMSGGVAFRYATKKFWQLALEHRFTIFDNKARFSFNEITRRYTRDWEDAFFQEKCDAYLRGEIAEWGAMKGKGAWYWCLPFNIAVRRNDGRGGRVGKHWPISLSLSGEVRCDNIDFTENPEYIPLVTTLMQDFVAHFEKNYPGVNLVVWPDGFDEPRYQYGNDPNYTSILLAFAKSINEYGQIIQNAVGDKILYRFDVSGNGWRRCTLDFNEDGESNGYEEMLEFHGDVVDFWGIHGRAITPRPLASAGEEWVFPYNFAWVGRESETPPYVDYLHHSVSSSGLIFRVLLAASWKARTRGFCMWRFMSHPGENNPFRKEKIEDGITFWHESQKYWEPREEWELIYWGDGCGLEGEAIMTFRTKQARRGIHDYEYLWLLTHLRKGDRSLADSLIAEVIPAVYDDQGIDTRWKWERKILVWDEWRKKVVRQILNASQKVSLPVREKENLVGVYPNPMNPECYIPVNVKSKMQNVKCKIYNILGQLVREIECSGVQGFKDSSVYWDGRDSRGLEVPSGVYFYEVAGEAVRKMVVLR
jgi:hypothetical protein